MSVKHYRDFFEYLQSRGISVADRPAADTLSEKIDDNLVHKHLELIKEFHERTMGISGFAASRLDNCTGKKVEQFKVHIKKLKRDIKRLSSEGTNTKFEAIVLKAGPELLARAEACVKDIYNNGYYELIERSMKRSEICLGNTYVDNLTKKEQLEINNINKACFNMVECDAIYFLRKLKKRGISIDYETAISEFCRLEGLGENSRKFITASILFPMEFMKSCERYRNGKKEWNEDEYEERLLRAIEKDGTGPL